MLLIATGALKLDIPEPDDLVEHFHFREQIRHARFHVSNLNVSDFLREKGVLTGPSSKIFSKDTIGRLRA